MTHTVWLITQHLDTYMCRDTARCDCISEQSPQNLSNSLICDKVDILTLYIFHCHCKACFSNIKINHYQTDNKIKVKFTILTV